jgi:RND family efflux transporter MFP subunit
MEPMTISQTPMQVHQRTRTRWHRQGHALACRALAGLRTRSVLVVLGSWLAAGSLAFAQGGPAPPPPVTVAKPVVKDIVEQTDFIGRFEAVDQVDIRARVSGYLDKVHFQDESLVRAGTLLFTIDPRPYRNALEQAKAAVTSGQVRLEFAQSDLARAEQLRMTGNIPDQIFDQRRQAFLTGKAELDRAQAALRQAQLDIEFTEIRAPLTGRISRKFVSEGNLVNANETLLTNIVSLHPIQFYFDVDERSFLAYAPQPQGGARTAVNGSANEALLTLTDERLGQRKGQLDFVDNRLDEASGTIRVRAVFDNKDMLLTPGLFGRVTIGASDPYKGILLPDEAIGSDQDRRVVYVVGENNVVHLKPVRIGPRIDGYRVIRDGLTGDETVVVNGLVRVRPGAPITPQMTTLPPMRERNGT